MLAWCLHQACMVQCQKPCNHWLFDVFLFEELRLRCVFRFFVHFFEKLLFCLFGARLVQKRWSYCTRLVLGWCLYRASTVLVWYLYGACMVLVWCLVLNPPITRFCESLLLRWSRCCRFIHQVKNALHQGVDRVLVGSLREYQKVADQVFYPGVCCRVR